MASRLSRLIASIQERGTPVLVRDSRRLLKGWGFIALFLGVECAALVVCLVWVEESDLDNPAEAGQRIALLLLWVFLLWAWVGVPLHAYAWIWGEKRDQTYDLLVILAMGEARATLGRMALAMSETLYLAIALVPFVSFAYLLGGFDLFTLFLGLVVSFLVSAALFLAGAAWSHLPEDSTSSAWMGGIFLILLTLSAGIVVQVLAFSTGGPFRTGTLGVMSAFLILSVMTGATLGIARSVLLRRRRRRRIPVLFPDEWDKVRLERICRSFGSHAEPVQALRRMSFFFLRGEIVGLVGSNGAGKTTLLRILATLDRPDTGDIWFGAESLANHKARIRKRTGFVPDYAGFYSNQTVEEFLDFHARAQGLRGENRRKTIDSVLAFTGLESIRQRVTSVLSKGTKQRLSFARAILHDPDLLILDEPMEGLDPRARFEFRELLTELARQGKSILVSSHVLSELDPFIDRLVVVDRGRLLANGLLDHMKADLGLGSSYRLKLRRDQDPRKAEEFFLATPFVRSFRCDGHEIVLDLDPAQYACDSLVHDLYHAGIRVESMGTAAPDLTEVYLRLTKAQGKETTSEQLPSF